jgi:hypothetical protein
MRSKRVLTVLALVGTLLYAASSASALPLITSVTEIGTMNAAGAKALDSAVPVVSSATQPGPGGTSGALVDEAFQFSDRTHEFTAPRVNASGVLTTAATGELRWFPYYLNNLEYIQVSNDNRDMTDYRLDVTLAAPVTAFLMIDNRNNGAATPPALNNPNTNDPILGGPLQWVIDDGWQRVRSGQMPGGRSDYLGSDEGVTVNTSAERVKSYLRTPPTQENVAGSGNGLNQFYSIYRKDFPAGTHTGFTKANGIPGGAIYTVAVSTPVGPIVAGDVNGSGVADINDYIVIRNNFLGTNRTRAQGDLTNDGLVNFADFRNWKDNRTAGSGSMTDEELFAGLGVPEPGSLALALFGALAWLAASRRRAG